MGQQMIRCPGKQVGYFLGRCIMYLAIFSLFSLFLGTTLTRGCRSLGFPPSLEPCEAAEGLVSAKSQWSILTTMGHDMATPGLTLLLSLFPLLCKFDQKMANLNIMVESPSSQSILDLEEPKVERKKSSLNTSCTLIYSVEFVVNWSHSEVGHETSDNKVGNAIKVLLLRLQRRIIINFQSLF